MKKAGALLSGVLGFNFRSHDLRRTAATRLGALGVPRDHISHVLNHTVAGAVATRVYDRYSYDTEKRGGLGIVEPRARALLADKPQAESDASCRMPRRRRRDGPASSRPGRRLSAARRRPAGARGVSQGGRAVVPDTLAELQTVNPDDASAVQAWCTRRGFTAAPTVRPDWLRETARRTAIYLQTKTPD